MSQWKTGIFGDEFQLKLPAVDNSVGVVVKYKIPRLTKPVLPTRSPNYLPWLPTSSFTWRDTKDINRSRNRLGNERNKLQRFQKMKLICQYKDQEHSPILEMHQPSWFKTFSVKYEQRRRPIVENDFPRECKRQGNLESKTLRKKTSKPIHDTKSKGNRRVKMESPEETTWQRGAKQEANEIKEKNYEYDIKTRGKASQNHMKPL